MAKEEFDESMLGYDDTDLDMEDEDQEVYIDDMDDVDPDAEKNVTMDMTDIPQKEKPQEVKKADDRVETVAENKIAVENNVTDEPDIWSEMTLKVYMEFKHKQLMESHFDEKDWNMLRSQINSAVQLGIKIEKIEIFAQPVLSYEQREVLKYAIYDGAEDEFIRNLTEKGLSADVMRAKIDDKKADIKMSEELSTPLQILSDSITAYKQDIDKYKEQSDKILKSCRDKLEAAEEEIQNLQKQLDAERKTNEDQLQIIRERERREHEKREFEDRVEKAAQEKFARMQLEEEAKRERQESERIRFEEELRQEKRTKRGLFSRKRNKEDDRPRKPVPLSTVQKLPAGFDLTAYIMSAGLSAGQMDVISLAVRSKVDDSLIKAMIDQQLPAAQMKQLLAVILARGHQGSSCGHEDVVYIEDDLE